MITTADLAAVLLARLRQMRGPDVAITDIDSVVCEDGSTTMLYCYLQNGDIAPLSFIPPPLYDEAELLSALLCGSVTRAPLH